MLDFFHREKVGADSRGGKTPTYAGATIFVVPDQICDGRAKLVLRDSGG
jgi:hypothetical protein